MKSDIKSVALQISYLFLKIPQTMSLNGELPLLKKKVYM